MTNNLISDILFLHTASLKSRCFLFIFIILIFTLDFRLVRKLVFLYFNVNVCLKEIPCLNKVTLPYLTFKARKLGFFDQACRESSALKVARPGSPSFGARVAKKAWLWPCLPALLCRISLVSLAWPAFARLAINFWPGS